MDSTMLHLNSTLLLLLLLAIVQSISSTSTSPSVRDVVSLSKWANDEGIVMHPKLEWKSYGDDDWGLVLKGSVPRGTIVLQIPRSLVLDSSVIRNNQKMEECDKVVEALGQFSVHDDNFWIVWQLYQLKCQKSHKFAPWLAAMPMNFPRFTPEEIDCLPFYAKYAAEYQETKLKAFCQAAQVIGGLNSDDERSIFQWAFQAVNSRFWKRNPLDDNDAEPGSELVPIGDMMNHRDPPNVQMIPGDPDHVTFGYLGDDDEKEFGDGSEKKERNLFLTYGQPSNPHRFLVIFGFAPQPTYMPKVWSHLVYENNPFSQDIDDMIIEVATGKVSQQVWDALLWELSEPPSLEAFQQRKDELHVRHKQLLVDILLSHVNQQLEVFSACRKKIVALKNEDSPNKELIQQQNEFLMGVFTKVKNNLSS